MMDFYLWFKEQSHRDDAVGWAAKWFLHKKQGRYPKEEDIPSTCEGWLSIVEAKAAKAHQLAARSSFVTAWKEFHNHGIVGETAEMVSEGSLGDVMNVRSTISRLRKVVKGSHEYGEAEEEELLAVERFSGPVATVGLRQRLTTSYGGDWVQLGVMLSLPCYVEEIDEAFEFADDWVTEKIQSEVDKFKGGGPPESSSGGSDGSYEEEKDEGDQETKPDPEKEPEEDSDREVESESDSGEASKDATEGDTNKESFTLSPPHPQDDTPPAPNCDFGI